MLGVQRLFLGVFLSLCLVILLTLDFSVTALALPGSSSVEVSAKIYPVRLVLVDQNDRIIKILSNTAMNVPPKVYMESFNSHPEALSASIKNQYQKIIKNLDTNKTGVIYHQTQRNKFVANIRWAIASIKPSITY